MDKRDGHGCLRMKNGDIYEGQWSDSLKDGFGIY